MAKRYKTSVHECGMTDALDASGVYGPEGSDVRVA